MYTSIIMLNTPRYRNTRAKQRVDCIEARKAPNVKTTLNESRHISRASYLNSAFNIHRFQQKISVAKYNSCNNNASNCGVYPYPKEQLPIKPNQFGVFVGGTGRMASNF